MSQFKSQLFGIALALTTAIGCIAYEKLVKHYSFGIIILLALVFYLPAFVFLFIFNGQTISSDLGRLFNDSKMMWFALLYVLTWITTPLWYYITRRQGVLVGSIYEVKYIVILVIFYILFGDGEFSRYTLVGVCFALLSIYFVSK